MKVLLVEDERPLGIATSRILRGEGYQVSWAEDGLRGLRAAKTDEFDLVILDVMLPEKNGWDVLSELRQAKVNVPVLMLTALDEVADKVKGLDLGADDYLAKPFDMLELIARVKALLRRERTHRSRRINIADLEIDVGARRVKRGGKEISLTKREYDLLEALASNEGRVLSRETIQERVWNDEESLSNTVDVFIGTLRKKLDAGFSKKLIHTVVGFGYVMRSED